MSNVFIAWSPGDYGDKGEVLGVYRTKAEAQKHCEWWDSENTEVFRRQILERFKAPGKGKS